MGWYIQCGEVIKEISRDGQKLEPRSMLGYVGVSAGNCFAGGRGDGSFLQLTGSYADRHFANVWSSGVKVSRIDLQITVRYTERLPDLGKQAYADAVDAMGNFKGMRGRKLTTISGSDGGYTLYIGSMHSEQRGRMYNKEAQCPLPEYERAWRYEVVFKNELALQVAGMLKSGAETRLPTIVEIVKEWYKRRGVDIDGLDAVNLVTLPLERVRRTDAEKRLLWLSEQVRPAVSWLLSNGYEVDVLDALDLKPKADGGSLF